ncbi:hypothetical protein [Actinotalea sp. C106]|uniref:hypothetical protein n=1 Tax=Actinotalea sp. C106 TaxID=2908644 RepID=UPI00202857A8|nr:hypothetical protein [Actinotalea sp. C106]
MERDRTATVVVLSAAVMLVPLAACSGPDGGAGLVEGGPIAYVTPSSDAGDGALLEGAVSVNETCVLIVDEFGQTWLPVFQRPRTTWDGTTLTYNGERYTDGSHIRLGGGGSAGTGSADYAPEGCEFDYAFYVGP